MNKFSVPKLIPYPMEKILETVVDSNRLDELTRYLDMQRWTATDNGSLQLQNTVWYAISMTLGAMVNILTHRSLQLREVAVPEPERLIVHLLSHLDRFLRD